MGSVNILEEGTTAVATSLVSGKHYGILKLALGTLDTNAALISDANPVPVKIVVDNVGSVTDPDNIAVVTKNGKTIMVGPLAADAKTPKTALVSISASGDNPIVAAVTGKIIRVIACSLVPAGAVSFTFRSATTAKSGAYPFAANVPFLLPPNEFGWVDTVAGQALNGNLSAAVGVFGLLQYLEV